MDPYDPELDDLLADVHRLLEEEPAEPLTAEDVQIDYRQFYDTPLSPVPDETMIYRPQPPKTRSQFWTETQRLPRHVAKLQKNQEQAYADWLYEQGRGSAGPPPPPPEKKRRRKPDPEPDFVPAPPKKKRHVLRGLIAFLLLLALAMTAVALLVLPRQPKAEEGTLGARRDGVSTILLAGTDASSARTDTLILLTLDQPNRRISLVSIPRDTLVNGGYTVPKINSVYAANNGGEEGIEMLLTRVSQCIGFRPDGYILIELDAFVDLVDALGGVKFDVPVDMFYNDPSQDLYIDLKAGTQTLSGREAMGLVRFRSSYATADLGRVEVQRAFLSALIDQAVSLKGAVKAPALLNIFLSHTHSDLTAGDYLWLARAALLADRKNIQTATLPGRPSLPDGSYYILDPASVAETVNERCNPYEADVTAADLEIRQG